MSKNKNQISAATIEDMLQYATKWKIPAVLPTAVAQEMQRIDPKAVAGAHPKRIETAFFRTFRLNGFTPYLNIWGKDATVQFIELLKEKHSRVYVQMRQKHAIRESGGFATVADYRGYNIEVSALDLHPDARVHMTIGYKTNWSNCAYRVVMFPMRTYKIGGKLFRTEDRSADAVITFITGATDLHLPKAVKRLVDRALTPKK